MVPHERAECEAFISDGQLVQLLPQYGDVFGGVRLGLFRDGLCLQGLTNLWGKGLERKAKAGVWVG